MHRQVVLRFFLVCAVLLAQQTAIAHQYWHAAKAPAEKSQPAKGDAKFSTTHNGVQYRFASAQNLARFQANPDAFLPQYGGYCAWAVSNGYTAKGDPTAWKVVNGKLYLNYDATVQKRWIADIPGNIAKGDHNWPQVLK